MLLVHLCMMGSPLGPHDLTAEGLCRVCQPECGCTVGSSVERRGRWKRAHPASRSLGKGSCLCVMAACDVFLSQRVPGVPARAFLSLLRTPFFALALALAPRGRCPAALLLEDKRLCRARRSFPGSCENCLGQLLLPACSLQRTGRSSRARGKAKT